MTENKGFQTLTKTGRGPLLRASLSLAALLLVFLSSTPSYGEFGSIVDIGLAGDLYLIDESANNGQGFVNLLIQNTWSESQLWVDLGAGGLVSDTASTYVKAPQLFYRAGSKNKIHLIVGRARHDWSFADEFWNLGLTQPIFRWNEAMPEQQGLTGLFLNIPISPGKLELSFFGSYLYLPSQGPTYDLADGNLTSSNPWFNEPVQLINFSGQQADLNFDVDVPKAQDIVFRPSYGIQLSTPRNKKGFMFNTFFLDKPRNDLVLPFEGVLNLSTFNGDITVRPEVARHDVAGVDIGWNFSNMRTIVSWLRESSLRYQAAPMTTYPIIPEQNIFSFNQLFRITQTQRLWLGYINVDRQANRIGGVFANTPITTYLHRNRFEEALRLKWEGLLFKSLNIYRVQASLAVNQSLIRDNIWLSTDIKWSLYKGLEMFSHCDFFGGSEKAIANVDFMSAYQNNDRCLIGGHYAF